MSAPGGGYQSPNYSSGGYQGLGFYGQEQAPPPKKPKRGLLIGLAAAAVVAIGVTTTLLIVNSGDDPQPTAGEPVLAPTLSSTGKSTTKPTSSTSRKPNDPLNPGTPSVPGWTVIPIDNNDNLKTSKAYDVPPGWITMGGSITFGTASKSTLIVPTVHLRGHCTAVPNSVRAAAGLMTANEKDGPKAAAAFAQTIGDSVYTTSGGKPKLDISAAQPVTVDRDKKGFVVTAKATPLPGTEKCMPASAIIKVMSLPPLPTEPDAGAIAVVAFGDQGFGPEATTDENLQKIVLSLHQNG